MAFDQDRLEVEITARQEHAAGIIVLDLRSPYGGALPRFEPGAHVDVMIGPGLVRQYSLCGDPACADRYRLGILLDPASRGGSAAVHEHFHVGERIRISFPRNNFPLTAAAGPAVLIGGGIGITPLLAMAHHLDATHGEFVLHYCIRDRNKAGFLTELANAPFRDRVHLHVDTGPDTQRFQPDRDLPPAQSGTHIYICGPAAFMDWVIASAKSRGYGDARIHREYFQAEADTSGAAFAVTLARTGKTVTVASGQSIVQALRTVGMRVDVSCEQGVCGTCICDVLDGVPDHRDSYLTDDEKAANDQMTLCCSRARTPNLVLDL